MARAPQRATTDGQNYLQVRLPGSLKNDVIDAAEEANVSVNAWLLQAIQDLLRGGMPAPAPVAPLPTHLDVIRGYLTGETVLAPCGQPQDECPGMGDRLSGDRSVDWCRSCGIRLT